MSAAVQSRAFPFEAGKPVKITTDRVARLLSTLQAAGYGCATHKADFRPGKYIVNVVPESGYSVSWQKLGGLREVAA